MYQAAILPRAASSCFLLDVEHITLTCTAGLVANTISYVFIQSAWLRQRCQVTRWQVSYFLPRNFNRKDCTYWPDLIYCRQMLDRPPWARPRPRQVWTPHTKVSISLLFLCILWMQFLLVTKYVFTAVPEVRVLGFRTLSVLIQSTFLWWRTKCAKSREHFTL